LVAVSVSSTCSTNYADYITKYQAAKEAKDSGNWRYTTMALATCKARRYRLTVSTPEWKAPSVSVSALEASI